MKLKDLFESLSMDEESRLSRAKSMGFDVNTIWYHGSKVGNFNKFDPKYINSGIVSPFGSSNKSGFYFSTDRNAAKYFADEEYIEKESDEEWNYDDIQVYGEDGEYYFLLNDVNKGPYSTWDEAESAATSIIDRHNSVAIGDVVHHDEKVKSYFLALKNPLTVNSMAEFRAAESTAQADGYDSVIGRDVLDGDMHSTIVVVFDHSIIRSTDAAFDPTKRKSDNINESIDW